MALKLQTNFNNGIVAEYYRMVCLNINFNTGKTMVGVDLFKDEATRRLPNAQAITTNYFQVITPALGQDIRADFYVELKKLDKFKTALDC